MAVNAPKKQRASNVSSHKSPAQIQRAETTARPDAHALPPLPATVGEQWLGTKIAQRALGLHSVNTVKAWARRGILRSITLPNGRVKVHRDDVSKWAALMATDEGDEPLSDAERRELTADRGGTNPWGRG